VRFCILGSSSSGNCALLQTPRSSVLIDAGFSGRAIKTKLAEFGQSIEDIDAVFITHEHVDHVRGLKGLSKLPHLKVFATYGTHCRVMDEMPDVNLNWQIIEGGSSFSFEDITVMPFSVPHDAIDTVGYLFSTGDGTGENPKCNVAWMTDLGHIPQNAAQRAAQADVLVIESNHDTQMLYDSDRPFSLKQRIHGRHGHLSNDATLAYLKNTPEKHWKHIYLAHISPECNDTGLVRKLFGNNLFDDGSCPISIIDPHDGCPDIVEFGPWRKLSQLNLV
jgi:phosphoribosyl 1,2-cyclic phosphodiesterase